jgi:outer membrane protein TolC
MNQVLTQSRWGCLAAVASVLVLMTPAAPGVAARQRATISGKLTLERAVEIALRESPVVRGAAEEVNVAIEELQAARAAGRPTVSATAFLSTGSNASITATPSPVMPQATMALPQGSFFDQNVSLMVPLYTGGRLESLVRRAQSAREASSAERDEVKLEVELLTRVAYRTAQVRQALLAVAQDLVRTNDERLRIARLTFREGRIPRYPVLRDEAELANATQQLTNAERDREMALVELRTVMGVDFAPDVALEEPPTLPSIEATVGPTATSQVPDLAGQLRVAEERRPRLIARRLRVRSAAENVSVARSAYRPQVSLFAMVDAMQGEVVDRFRGYTAGVVAALPLVDGGARRAEQRRAEAEARREEEELESVRLQVVQEVTSRWLAVRAAERNVATAQAGVQAGEEEYRIAQLRYQEGKSANVEALDALFARTRARVNLVQAVYEYQVAADQLRRATGSL